MLLASKPLEYDTLMAYFLGIENGHLAKVGRFNPPVHRGVDVFAEPGSRVRVPIGAELQIVRSTFDRSYYKGQAFGWIIICDERYGFVAAHLDKAPLTGKYIEREVYGRVAGGVSFTPHCHIALARDHIPPPGDVDPVVIWEACLEERG